MKQSRSLQETDYGTLELFLNAPSVPQSASSKLATASFSTGLTSIGDFSFIELTAVRSVRFFVHERTLYRNSLLFCRNSEIRKEHVNIQHGMIMQI